VAHACNPSYSGGRDQEDLGLKPAQGKKLPENLSRKTIFKNRAGGVALSSSPSTAIIIIN
jgi:hypothetical protein